jgi:PAS domain S-box-containing protein
METTMLDKTEILNARILIVDDQKPNVMLLEKILRDEGYLNVMSTMDPHTVRALHQTHLFDLILLDLQMPGMDGFQVIEALKGIDADSYLPVMVVTAQPALKLRALQAGAKDFVSKPFDLVEVQTRIFNMLEVRLLYRRLDVDNRKLEQAVLDRTAQLRESEARFKNFTRLSADWYWEQDEVGQFTEASGPVQEMLGLQRDELAEPQSGDMVTRAAGAMWNEQERDTLNAFIADRKPFIDFIYRRTYPNSQVQYFQVSGEPIFDASGRFTGYRGVGSDVSKRMPPGEAR